MTGKLWDSTAGSWIGTRPQSGIQGLPAEYPVENPDGSKTYRHPLSPTDAVIGWPGRIAARLDRLQVDDSLYQDCSASLVGPKFAMTAAHCLVYPSCGPTIQEGWVTDSLYLRPGFNLGKSAPGYDRVRVVKSMLMRTKFPGVAEYAGDDEWALLELEKDVGTELGWARVIPINYAWSIQWLHMMGYPQDPPACPVGSICDMATKTDTLCHSWVDTYFNPLDGTKMVWNQQGGGWGGESGAGVFRCSNSTCSQGDINLVGVRWTVSAISSMDSTMTGIIATLLKDVKVPTATTMDREPGGFELRMISNALVGNAPRDGEWQILSLDGRAIGAPSFGRNLSVPADRLPRGVALVVFRAPGQAPVTRRWVGR
ncbi:MAG: hypothetical protein AAB214_07985 [Fibrobacterota bacterium]